MPIKTASGKVPGAESAPGNRYVKRQCAALPHVF